MLFILEKVTRGPEATHEQLNKKPALGAWVLCNTHSGKDLLLSVLGQVKVSWQTMPAFNVFLCLLFCQILSRSALPVSPFTRLRFCEASA